MITKKPALACSVIFKNITRTVLLFLCLSVSFNSWAGTVNIIDINNKISKQQKQAFEYLISVQVVMQRSLLERQTLDLPVRLFDNFKRYKRYQAKISNNAQSDNGFYSTSLGELVIFENDNYLKTTLHEASHFIVRRYIASPKKWFNEGLAEVFETTSFSDKKLFLKQQSSKVRRLQRWHDKDALLSIKQVIGLSNTQWSDLNSKPDYQASSHSWGLIYFLMSSHQGRNVLLHLAQAMSVGNLNFQPVFDQHYPDGLAQAERDWSDFVAHLPEEILL